VWITRRLLTNNGKKKTYACHAFAAALDFSDTPYPQ
jgi:hypothetical protein